MKAMIGAGLCALFVGAGVACAAAVAPVVTPLGCYGTDLRAPARVAAGPDGAIYVVDPVAGAVVCFDAFGRRAATVGGLAGPLGIAVDALGRIYLGEGDTGSVSVFDPQWNRLYKLGTGDGEFQQPNHIALNGTSAVYVADSPAHVVKVYADGVLTNQFGGFGTANGQFDYPAGLCVSTGGEVFVVDQNNDRVQVFDLNGAYKRRYKFGGMLGPSGRKQGAAVDGAGRLYVADAFLGQVKVYNATNGVSFGAVGSFGTLAGQLSAPGGIALDPWNRLLVASASNSRLDLFGIDGFLHVAVDPSAAAVASGTGLVFRAIVGGAGPFSYQWRKDGQNLADATNDTFALAAAGAGDTGGYGVTVTGPAGALTSAVAAVRVLDPPAILADPYSRTVVPGMDVPFEVAASGSDLTYQWQHNGRDIEGATNSVLLLPAVETVDAGNYGATVRNAVGAAVSAGADLQVIVPPTVLEILAVTLPPDQALTLTINADPGYWYTLETSTNLVDWEAVTPVYNDAGIQDVADPAVPDSVPRFYRLRWLL